MFSKYSKTYKTGDASNRSDWTDPVPAFGKDMKDQESYYGATTIDLNQGSFGVAPRRVLQAAQQYREHIESNPFDYFVNEASSSWAGALDMLAKDIGADVQNLAFCNNTSTGTQNILTSYPFNGGDVILYNNYTYGNVKNQIQDVVDNRRPGVLSLQLSYPETINSKQDIIQLYEDTLTANPAIKLAVIDHISSSPVIVFPVKELVDVCHAHGVEVLVDGAHAPGQLPLNIQDLGAEFYIGNLYKWNFGIRGCGFQYVIPSYHDIIIPCMRGGTGTYPTPFRKQGADDGTDFVVSETSMGFYNWVGGMSAIQNYASYLFEYLPELLAAWGTEEYPLPTDMKPPLMRTLRVPDLPGYEKSDSDGWRLFTDLSQTYNIWTRVDFNQNELWIRISGSIFVDQSDLEALKDAILDLKSQTPGSAKQQESRARFEATKCLLDQLPVVG